jgi:hypothetical protein
MKIPLLAVGGSWGDYWIEAREKSKQVKEQMIQNHRI